MSKYTVMQDFCDLKDGNYVYHVGDIYPHDDARADKNRLEELLSNKNKIGAPLIREEAEQEEEKKTTRRRRK